MLKIAYDREESNEMNARYFVFDTKCENAVVYKGTYTQCLVVCGAPRDMTLEEINSKTNGFLNRIEKE